MMRKFIFICILFVGCERKQQTESQPETQLDSAASHVTPEDAYEKVESNFDFKKFYGVFDHESTTKGFAAVLSIKQHGRDLYFTVSVSQGNCKKGTEGVVMMPPEAEKFPTGFYQSDNCRLQFTFAEANTSVDIKEITFCGLDGAACSYEGTYKKRIN